MKRAAISLLFSSILITQLCMPASALYGSEKITLAADDSGTQLKLLMPFATGFDSTGNMYIVLHEKNQIARLNALGELSLYAGTGEKGDSGDGGPALKAAFNGPHHLIVASNGDVFVADTYNCRVRKIDAKTGIISNFAGTEKGFGGDGGPALKAQFSGIYCLALSANGERMYLDDLENRRVRAIDMQTGIVSTVAGNSKKGIPADGASALESPLLDPRAITIDSKGNLYILERGGNALRMVDSGGKIHTVAGTGKTGASGDGGPAIQATMNGPKHLCVDLEDNVLIADTENHLIRKYMPRDGKIILVAGTGKAGSSGVGGPPGQCQLNRPHGVFVDRTGALYISDSLNNRVLKIQ